MADKTVMKGRLTPRMIRGLRWTRYLVITIKGLRFAKRWYHAKYIPPHIARLYQPLLKLIQSKRVLPVGLVGRMGYGGKTIEQALSRGYVKLVSRPSVLSDSVRDKVFEMKGEAPGWVYA